MFWLDDPDRPTPASALIGRTECDLLVVGGGFTGLWTAYLAKQRDPNLDVLVIEADEIATGATGRNGGFCDYSLTHGLRNGLSRFPDELERLEEYGLQNLNEIESVITNETIDCHFERTGRLLMAVTPWQIEELETELEARHQFGHDVEFLDAEQAQREVRSPTYLAGLRFSGRTALINPARLAWGLRAACLRNGVRLHEHTPAVDVTGKPRSVTISTPYGVVEARRVALATNAFKPVLPRIKKYILPVYDYVLVTEPLSQAHREAIGWKGRQGIDDAGNQFHYYRLTADDRILFGGYDAIYHYNNGMRFELEQRSRTFTRLATHFFQTFPQLEGVRFTHTWGGAIDTCSRFFPFWGRAFENRLAYCVGFTGLGVGASRFGARVMLDLLYEPNSPLTQLQIVKQKPLPFPPEPLRASVVNLTRWSLAQADKRGGRRNLWLRTLDRVGLGFDS